MNETIALMQAYMERLANEPPRPRRPILVSKSLYDAMAEGRMVCIICYEQKVHDLDHPRGEGAPADG